MKSIIQSNKECYVCKKTYSLEMKVNALKKKMQIVKYEEFNE